jgi:hypothetical protein
MYFPNTNRFLLSVLNKCYPDASPTRNDDPRGKCKDPGHLFWMIEQSAVSENRDKVQRWLAYVACSLEWLGVITNDETRVVFKSDTR